MTRAVKKYTNFLQYQKLCGKATAKSKSIGERMMKIHLRKTAMSLTTQAIKCLYYMGKKHNNFGYFNEGNEIHYVVLNKEKQNRNDEPQDEQDTLLGSLLSNGDMTNNEPQSESDTELGSPLSNVEKQSDKYFTFFNCLPSEITKLIFLYALSVLDLTFPRHVCWT